MILGVAATEPTESLLDVPGAFAWWYLDLIDPMGRSLVLIWSWGLPFLPAPQRDVLVPARSRPSLSVSLYEGGRSVFSTLFAPRPGDAETAPHTQRVGESRVHLRPDGVRAELDVPVPGTTDRLTGVVEVSGSAPRLAADAAPGDYAWRPLFAPAQGTAALRCGVRRWALHGSAYVDRNESAVPLWALGIRRWLWARFDTGRDVRLVYAHDTEHGAPDARVLIAAPDGEVTAHSVRLAGERHTPGRFGLRRTRSASAVSFAGTWALRTTAWLDDGPFYQRMEMRARIDGRDVPGIGEVCEPARIGRLAPLVQMAVDDRTRAPSPWLPLFAGPAGDRWRRLAAFNLGARP